MANYVSNGFYIYGKKENVIHFYKDMKKGDFEKSLPPRVSITNLQLINNGNGVEIEMESPWDPYNEQIQEMLDKNYPKLKMVYQAEECGEGIYINTDINHIYYKDKYYLDYSLNQDNYVQEYFETKDKLIDYLMPILNLSRSVIDSLIDSDDVDLSEIMQEKLSPEFKEKLYSDKNLIKTFKKEFYEGEWGKDRTMTEQDYIDEQMNELLQEQLDDIYFNIHEFLPE